MDVASTQQPLSYSMTPRTSSGSNYSHPLTQDNKLFILHDNPQLRANVASLLPREKVKVLMETKMSRASNPDFEGKTVSLFLLGNLTFSGPIEKIMDANEHCSVGSECFVIEELVGYLVSIKEATKRTRSSDQIIEIDIACSPLASFPPEAMSPLHERMPSILEGFEERIDIVLKPQVTETRNFDRNAKEVWVPYWEGSSGRKMAPQFKSHGLGYLRLGDDMGKMGKAFLSTDGGFTFLEHA